MKSKKTEKAVLVLEDGTCFEGRSIGIEGEQVGEVCFNTSMTGYQEILTDPSYAGQIVTMTAPQIGNVGCNPEDMESTHPRVRGFVIRDCSPIAANWRSREELHQFLRRFAIPAIEGVDTRQLTRILRSKGAQRGVLSSIELDRDILVDKARAWPGMQGMDLVSTVTTGHSYPWRTNIWSHGKGFEQSLGKQLPFKVAVLDYGVKHNILRHLVHMGCDVTVYPAQTTAEEILRSDPDGIFLSNGPGDPEAVTYAIESTRHLVDSGKPLFGICLGHQILCLALGGESLKLKFGHRGGNHPVQNVATGAVEVTAQNHGFVIREQTLPASLEVTHRSLFDGSLEGVRHRTKPVFSVQYHPEASPGPHDSHYLFRQFLAWMQK